MIKKMKTIMIVDDEPNIFEKIRSSLESDDFEIITAANNRKALEEIRDRKEEDVNLILVDTLLPDSNIPALFSMKPGSRMNTDTNNMECFLQKPFTKGQLLDFVRRRAESI